MSRKTYETEEIENIHELLRNGVHIYHEPPRPEPTEAMVEAMMADYEALVARANAMPDDDEDDEETRAKKHRHAIRKRARAFQRRRERRLARETSM